MSAEIGNEANEEFMDPSDNILLLQIFPLEVWRQVLEHLKDWKDCENTALACSLFRDILEEQKTQWMFRKIIPLLRHHLTRKEKLHCRLVCSRWAYGVERYYEDFKSLDKVINHEDWSPLNHSILMPRVCYVVKNLTDYLRCHPRNPFIGRYVTVIALPFSNYLEFYIQMEQFMKDVGHHIYHLQLKCRSRKPSQMNSVVAVCLERCSNLRSLRLPEYDIDPEDDDTTEEDIRQWQQLLPACPQLETVIIDWRFPYGIAWFQDILFKKYSEQLKTIFVTCWNPELYAQVTWSKLERIRISSKIMLDILPTMTQIVAPSLHQLEIDSSCINHHEEVDLVQELLALTHSFPSLHTIHFISTVYNSSTVTATEQRRLSEELVCSEGIKRLEVTLRTPKLANIRLFFLRRFTSLKSLQIHVTDGEYFQMVEDAVSEMNLWGPLPKLKEIKIYFGNVAAIDDDIPTRTVVHTRQNRRI